MRLVAIRGGLPQYPRGRLGLHSRRGTKLIVTTVIRQVSGASAPAENARALFLAMLRMRRFEEKAGMLYALGVLGTPTPLGIGQEGAIAALAAATTSDECVIALEPAAGLSLALGETPGEVFQRLRPSENYSAYGPALLRLPGEPPRHLDIATAVTTAASNGAGIVVVGPQASTVMAVAAELANVLLAVVIVPIDRKPPMWLDDPDFSLRECDGADARSVSAAIAAAREGHGRGAHRIGLAGLTPPYGGHARTSGQRAPVRQNHCDPLAQCRQQLIDAGVSEAEITAIEVSAREEIAAAARSIAIACAP